MAYLIASNELSIINSTESFSAIEKKEYKVSLNNRHYIVKKNITSTPNPFFHKVEIAVASEENPNYNLIDVISFQSMH